jgi:hypothetical protein
MHLEGKGSVMISRLADRRIAEKLDDPRVQPVIEPDRLGHLALAAIKAVATMRGAFAS